jgi:hypothetical protein
LEFLRCLDEAVDAAKDWSELRVSEARLDTVRIGRAEIPIVPPLKPPGLASIRLKDLARIRHAPDAEFRADQRLVAALPRVLMG